MVGLDPVSRRLVPLSEEDQPELWKIRLLRMLDMGESKSIIPVERIERGIYFIRDQKVMLNTELAALYDVPTKRINEAVKRNKDRFPEDFVFPVDRRRGIKLEVANCDLK